ncbi:HupE/UreJ family protein [Cellulomonas endometrii]|uniref:HupE/UreJ family protein n=1 Tax=Cellulomonas endometrii TaxID=3036301 RepID=UPI0024AE06EA|nr:HupE/UreJ family protein [Cellulomonas endometrii]
MLGGVLAGAAPAAAHGFTSVVFAYVTAPRDGVVRSELGLEYDLLVVSAADAQGDDPLFQDGTAAFESGDPGEQSAALEDHAGTVLAYVGDRYTVTSAGEDCVPRQAGEVRIEQREGVPYAFLTLDHTCAASDGAHEISSTLFGDDEGYVTGTTTVVTYALDATSGSAALDAAQPSFSTEQSGWERFAEFFTLGAEHLLFGLDHVLFLLAVIVGSRRLREIVLTATAFTVAHSITFVLAATGLVHVSGAVVEPVIALSIAVVAGWHLWRIRDRGEHAGELAPGTGRLGLDRSGWVRVGVVLVFGLVHGLGFAGALGIDEPWSWTLLWSLLVFNVGIEAVQLAIIAVVFPVLALLRRRVPGVATWVTGTVAAGVAVMGLVWFVQRLWGG